VNHEAVETSSKNHKVSRKRSTRSTSDTTCEYNRMLVTIWLWTTQQKSYWTWAICTFEDTDETALHCYFQIRYE